MSLGFVFPGQGSQFVGMLADVAAEHPQVEEIFTQAGEAIDQPLWDIVQNGPEDRLNSTEITQPALLVASVALWTIWRANEISVRTLRTVNRRFAQAQTEQVLCPNYACSAQISQMQLYTTSPTRNCLATMCARKPRS